MIAPELVRQAQSGDQRAFGDLLAALRPTVVRYCAAKLDRNDVEDVVQDALMRLVNAIDVYRPVAPIEAYAMRITSNAIANHYRCVRRGARVVPLAKVPEQSCPASDSEQRVLRAELASVLAAQVRTLPGRQKDIVLLRVVHGLSAEETAHLLDTTPGAVRVAQHRAVRRLRKTVAGAL